MDKPKYRWDEITQGKKVFWGASLAVMLAVMIALIAHSSTLADADDFDEYALSLSFIPGLQATDDNPYIKGKVVVIDFEAKRLDPINDSLSADLRATNKAELGTVVWLQCDDQVVGRYSSGGSALVVVCNLTIIDVSKKAKVGFMTIRGPQPPSYVRSRTSGQSHSGGKPTEEIVRYLASLPRR